jgi:16S rRNA processing protein RimM
VQGHDARSPARWLRAGIVAAPHGLDGSFRVAEGNARLLQLGAELMLGGARRAVTRRAGDDARIIIRVEGCEDRAAAVALRGAELLVERSRAPELAPEEWWAEDLEGCLVQDRGEPVGIVRRLLALPSCEVLEVVRPGARELLVPLVSDAVLTVDVERAVIEIDLGFLGER